MKKKKHNSHLILMQNSLRSLGKYISRFANAININ